MSIVSKISRHDWWGPKLIIKEIALYCAYIVYNQSDINVWTELNNINVWIHQFRIQSDGYIVEWMDEYS